MLILTIVADKNLKKNHRLLHLTINKYIDEILKDRTYFSTLILCGVAVTGFGLYLDHTLDAV